MGKDVDKIFDKVIDDIKKDLTYQTPPKVVYDPKKKTISVQDDFGLGLIKKVKFIASSEKWLEAVSKPKNSAIIQQQHNI